MKRARYVIETRTKSKRTASGYTKWEHYIVAERLEDAERTVAGLGWWAHDYEGEVRIVDRQPAVTPSGDDPGRTSKAGERA